jgi:hypothetical protein
MGNSLVVHLDSTSAIARMGHTGAGPGQEHAVRVQRWVTTLSRASRKRTVDIAWVKGHAGTPGNERADQLAGKAAELVGTHTIMSLAHIKLRISERFREAKDTWHANPAHHGTEEIPPPQEVHAGPSEELHCTHSGPDQDWPLAFGRILKADPQERNGPLLAV